MTKRKRKPDIGPFSDFPLWPTVDRFNAIADELEAWAGRTRRLADELTTRAEQIRCNVAPQYRQPGVHREAEPMTRCHGKAAYRTRTAAETALRLAVYLRRTDVDSSPIAYTPVRCYRCRNCRHWHLTSWPGKPWRNHA